MAPVIQALQAEPSIDSLVCVTGQHRQMLDQVLSLFEIESDHDLAVMTPNQTLPELTSAVLSGLSKVLEAEKPDWILVHGDTTTTLCGALAGFYARCKVAHVEAGLRTYDLDAPWPEELNRTLVSKIAQAHFAPTHSAKANLLAEHIDPKTVEVTGNTVIDALHWVSEGVLNETTYSKAVNERFSFLDDRRLILVTGHRRESFGGGLKRTFKALRQIAARGDVQIVYPVHLNPVVRAAANDVLDGIDGVYLIEPQEYLPFVWLMQKATLIVTDSGGIQEEAPALAVPVLVTREHTERPEAVEAGGVKLVGTNTELIVQSVEELLENQEALQAMKRCKSPYGDGSAAKRIVNYLLGREIEAGISAKANSDLAPKRHGAQS